MSIPSTLTPRDASRGRAGFTLIEIMVVVAIIGLLLTFVAPNVWNQLRKANVTTTEAKMTNLKQHIGAYRIAHGRLPERLEDLLQPDERNLGDPWIESEDEIQDAWGYDFQYEKISSSKFNIISLGADGMEGGEGDDADIHSLKTDMPR